MTWINNGDEVMAQVMMEGMLTISVVMVIVMGLVGISGEEKAMASVSFFFREKQYVMRSSYSTPPRHI